jgi:DNA-binding beta-propeller fold protein YncE
MALAFKATVPSNLSNISKSVYYQFVKKWGSNGTGDGQFDGPFGIAIDSSGNVYVTDYNHDRIQVFTSAN